MRSSEYNEDQETQAKQQGDHNHQVNLNNMLQHKNQPSPIPSSRLWTSAFRNPRIVPVSRAFGGKDRHSKVSTVRGLRDRRIRLSVPTAVQLYNLQDRLGLSQPSKVIDWLLEVAKDDVDELPPLQFPHGFNQMYPSLIGESSSSAFQGTTTSNLGFLDGWDLGASSSRTRPRIIDTTTNPYNNNTSSYYNLGHLQHSLDHQSSNSVTVAISNVPNNNNLNMPGPLPPTMSSLFPTYPSFFGASHHHQVVDGAENLQLFGSNANTTSQQQMMTGNSSLKRPFDHFMSFNHDMDRHS